MIHFGQKLNAEQLLFVYAYTQKNLGLLIGNVLPAKCRIESEFLFDFYVQRNSKYDGRKKGSHFYKGRVVKDLYEKQYICYYASNVL